MAALTFYAQPSAAIALSAATAKTVIQIIAPTNQRVKVKGWGVFFDGASPTAVPVLVQLVRQTTAIGGTPGSVTLYKGDDMIGTTIQTTAKIYGTSPTEPTTTDITRSLDVHPQTGYQENLPYGDEIIIGSGERMAIVITAPAVVNAIPFFRLEE